MNSLPEQTEALAHLRKELRETLLRLHGPLLGGEPLAAVEILETQSEAEAQCAGTAGGGHQRWS